MKHLKLFENHNQYYEEISDRDFNKEAASFDATFIRDVWVDFSREELNIIKSLFPRKSVINSFEYYDTRDITRPSYPQYTKGMIVCTNNPYFKPKDRENWNGTRFTTIKVKDEWFYAFDWNTGKKYRCDQIEGLSKLIKDQSCGMDK